MFLASASDTDEQFGKIIHSLRELVIEKFLEATEEIKYGGICFFDAGLLVGGIFPRKMHVSLEFSEGANMTDPQGLLEGKGKFRRHLKIRTMDDIEEKKVPYYLSQALHE